MYRAAIAAVSWSSIAWPRSPLPYRPSNSATLSPRSRASSGGDAAIAAAAVADDVGLTISVIGTPAEEVLKTGGKILLLDRGAFDGMHAAMMAHPAPWDVAMWPIVAASFFEVHYTGRASHASGFPHLGINAADAITIAQTSVGLLRQHLRQSDRVHGIVTKGGDAFNIIPASTSADFAVRARTLDDLGDVYEKVLRCSAAGAANNQEGSS